MSLNLSTFLATLRPVSGFTLSDLTTQQLDSTVFNNCTFLTNDSSSSHPINGTGTLTLAELNAGANSFLVGSITDLILTGNIGTSTCTVKTGGAVASASLTGDSYNGFATINYTTGQTSAAAATGSLGGGNGSAVSVTANSATNFAMENWGPDDVNNTLTINASAATSVDMGGFSGSGTTGSDAMTLNVGAPETMNVAANISIVGSTDIWNGSWTDAAITNAILAAYVAGGGSSGTLIIGGAAPTGQGIVDYATLLTSGVSVSTN